MHPQSAFTDFAASAVPAEVRCLMSDSGTGTEHEHASAELILNFGSTLGAVVWRDSAGGVRTTTIDVSHCCVIPAGVRHSVDGLSPRGLVSLLVEGVARSEVMRASMTEVLVEHFRDIAANDALAAHLMTEFGRLLGRESHTALVQVVGTALAVKLLHAFTYPPSTDSRKVSALSPDEQKRAVDYIAAHLAEHIGISTLARHCSMSRTHFTRRFRATFGVSPLQYTLKMRVDKALELLRTGKYRVAEAADAVGFFDQSHLDRHCHKFYGVPPSALQRA